MVGDVLEQLVLLPDQCIQTVVTSPPYWGLRDYGMKGQIGLEDTPEEYCARIVHVFKEVHRVLRNDGTLWLNLGDSYASEWACNRRSKIDNKAPVLAERKRRGKSAGLKEKDMVGIPWRVAFALQADGWYLRSDIIWSKPNPMPESVTDRPTKAHEYVFLMTKSAKYFYDAAAIRERATCGNHHRNIVDGGRCGTDPSTVPPGKKNHGGLWKTAGREAGRNCRSVWEIATYPYPQAHFATFPEKLVEPCILAGSKQGDIVLDPFMGSGTTALVALKALRKFVGVELNPKYAKLAERRIAQERDQMRLM